MIAPERPKQKARKKTTPPAGRPPLSPPEVQSLRDFIIPFALGDGHLTAWEENFLNDLKFLLSQPSVWLSEKQQAIILQLKDKLHYDRPDVPLPPIDPDGIEENNDPDGWPVTRYGVDQFEDDELLDAWAGVDQPLTDASLVSCHPLSGRAAAVGQQTSAGNMRVAKVKDGFPDFIPRKRRGTFITAFPRNTHCSGRTTPGHGQSSAMLEQFHPDRNRLVDNIARQNKEQERADDLQSA